MKKNSAFNKNSAKLLAFGLIPLSGFALDVYIPSLPDIAEKLHSTPAAIQLTLSVFLISLGVWQLFIGSILDSFGRYLPTVAGLALFSAASFVIAMADSLMLIYIMRAMQGIAVATIIVSKRAVFVDLYHGEELKRYTSMFSVIWAAAPIIAPFVGGFLQVHFGWRSNFYFLGGLGLMFLVLELFLDGETLQKKHPFNFKSIAGAYKTMISAKDFSMGIIILGCCYTMIMVYAMTSPFLIEKVMGYSPSVTGNAALVSGLAVMSGGLLSRKMIGKPFFKKVLAAAVLMSLSGLIIMSIAANNASLYTLLAYVVTIHLGGGFVFNSVFSYVLTRFTNMGGKAGGLAGGTYIIITSTISQSVVSMFNIKTQVGLGVSYLMLIILFFVIFISTKWVAAKSKDKQYKEEEVAVVQPVID